MFVVILILILSLSLLFFLSIKSSFGEHKKVLNKFIYYNEKNKKIDHFKEELEEQKDALEFIDSTDIVLELGGRYGTVSNAIAYKQNNSGNLIVVEPDTSVISALTNNKNINKMNYTIINNYISNTPKNFTKAGYGSMTLSSKNEYDPLMISYSEFKNKFPLKFNVLVADCEGCLGEFLEMIGDDIHNYNKILFEADQPKMCDYDLILNKLHKLGFKTVKKNFNAVYRYVLIK